MKSLKICVDRKLLLNLKLQLDEFFGDDPEKFGESDIAESILYDLKILIERLKI